MGSKLKFLFDVEQLLHNLGLTQSQANIVNIIIGIIFILLLAFLSDIISRKILVMGIARMVARTKNIWDDVLLEKKVFKRLSHLAPAIVLWYSAGHVLSHFTIITGIIQKLLSIYMIIVVLMTISAFLKGLNDIFLSLPAAKGRSIKGYTQVIQIIIYSIAFISVISIITGTSPKVLLTGLGAAAAVLMLVFKDTILGFVAGIQLSANDMLRIDDWITMTKYGADGTVMEISLNTVKVRNFDKTITTIPTYTLVSDSFINWRGVKDEDARRFKKHLSIDMKSVKYCTPEMIDRLKHLQPVKDYIEHNSKKAAKNDLQALVLHAGEVTNLTLFRKYTVNILKNHPGINQKLPMMIRQLQPAETGLPLEITAFCKGTDALVLEELQSDLFDHLIAVLTEFELAVFQYSTTFR